MATNFEFYQDIILEAISYSDLVITKDGTFAYCAETSCSECVMYEMKKSGACSAARVKEFWNAEHIEQPKLTKRERAFCEYVGGGYIARDACGKVAWYNEKPKKAISHIERCSEWRADSGYWRIMVDKTPFSFIRWEDETPWSVEDLLKLEVLEDA